MLNTVYKITSSSSCKIKNNFTKFIARSKIFLKGKYTGEDVRSLYDTLLCTSKYQVLGLLLMVDFEKAFDSVASSFMEKYLNK